jgi:hypothetical protein
LDSTFATFDFILPIKGQTHFVPKPLSHLGLKAKRVKRTKKLWNSFYILFQKYLFNAYNYLLFLLLLFLNIFVPMSLLFFEPLKTKDFARVKMLDKIKDIGQNLIFYGHIDSFSV